MNKLGQAMALKKKDLPPLSKSNSLKSYVKFTKPVQSEKFSMENKSNTLVENMNLKLKQFDTLNKEVGEFKSQKYFLKLIQK